MRNGMRGTKAMCQCARCIELGFPLEMETTESDVDDETSASDEEAEAE